MNTPPTQLDLSVQTACARADFRAATTLILDALGADVVRILHARFLRDDLTGEVFSRFAEDLWTGIPAFGFRCSVRAWVFTLARNAGSRFLDRELRHARKEVPLSQAPEVLEQAERIRTATMAEGASERMQRLSQMRAELSEEDQLLLTLRIDRELDFLEIAVVTLGNADAEAADVTREAARLRKRFQLVKDRLRKRWSEGP